MPPYGDLLIILALILANGFFAAAEIAIITARRARLEQQAKLGNRSARIALELARDPNRFLPTVQVGITLVATLAAVFSGDRFVDYLAAELAMAPFELVVRHRAAIALGIVVLSVTFLSLVVGELVPKRLALANAERLARFVAYPMHWLALAGRPAVWLMGSVTDTVLYLIGQRRATEPTVSLEDIEHLIRTGTVEGILEPAEQQMASKALRLGDRAVREIMRPRIDIDALDVDTPADEVIGAVAMAGFSRLPIHEGDLDHIIGFVYTKDLLRQQHMGWPIELRKLVRPALLVPETLTIARLLEDFRKQRTQMAIVLDEFGGTEGLVTMEDVLEELVGEIHDEYRQDDEQRIVQRDETSWLIDGDVNLDDLLGHLDLGHLRSLPHPGFNTIAGLVMARLDRIPRIGDVTDWECLRLEVVDMDGPRIDRVMVSMK